MYKSKYYTCEEIDQRLLEGYYDDFKKAGFVGSKEEFFKFVLSIDNKVDREDGKGLSTNDFTDELKDKLDSLIVLTKVSELENDANYQTAEQVQEAINSLIDSAPDALDTLRELAEALGDDPNFAANITNKLTDILNKLNDEIARAIEAEANINQRIDNLDGDTSSKLENIQDKIEKLKLLLEDKIQTVKDSLDNLRNDLNDFKIQEAQDISQVREYAHAQIDRETERAQEAELDLLQEINDIKRGHTSDISDLNQKLSQETSERKAADQSLTDNLSQETSERKAADKNLQQNLDKEVQDRKEAIQALDDKLNSDLSSNQTELTSKLETEISERKAGDLKNETAITVEKSERKAADDILDHKIEDLKNSLDDYKGQVSEDLAKEIADRKAADNDLDNKKVDKREGYDLSQNNFTDELKKKLESIEDNAKNIERVSQLVNDLGFQTEEDVAKAIEAIIDSAPDTLNTLRELAEALGDDPNFAATLTKKITAITEQLNAEIDSRKEKDEEILSKLAQETSDRKEADEAIKDLINREAESRKEADNLILEKINTYKETQDQINQSTSEAISELRSQSGTELTQIKDLISTNVANIQRNFELIQKLTDGFGSVEILVQERINIEKKRAEAAEAELLEKIKEAVADYNSKINNLKETLNNALETEKSERQAADKDLSDRIESNKSALDREINDRTTADTLLQQNIDNEESARESADNQITENLNQEAQERKEADTNLQNKLNTEAQERKEADATEESERKAGDENLQNQIDQIEGDLNQEIQDRKAGDSTLQTNIDNEKLNRETADENLQNQIDTNRDNLAQETKNRKEAISALNIHKLDTPESGENVYEEYELLDKDSNRLGVTIKIYKDSSLDDVDYVNTDGKKQGQFLKFVYSLSDGSKKTVYLDISEVLTESEFKDGLQVTDHVVSVKVDPDSEEFLEVTKDGVKLTGIQEAIDTAKNEVQSNLDSEVANLQAADNDLSDKLETETTERKAADGNLQQDINQEVTKRTEDVDNLQTSLEQETTERNRAVNEEASNRKNADDDLQNQVDDLDSKLNQSNNDLKSEASDRMAEDKKLQDQLDSIIPISDQDILDITSDED